jgi:hypothetical protein
LASDWNNGCWRSGTSTSGFSEARKRRRSRQREGRDRLSKAIQVCVAVTLLVNAQVQLSSDVSSQKQLGVKNGTYGWNRCSLVPTHGRPGLSYDVGLRGEERYLLRGLLLSS